MTEEIQNNKELRDKVFLLFVDRVLDTFDKVLSQFTSGRWILTVAAATIMVVVCLQHFEYVKEFKEIIAVIIYAYFQRGDRGQETKTTETKTVSESKTP